MSKLESGQAKYFSVSDYKPIVTYFGDVDLFKSLELALVASLPEEAVEWRRMYGRGANVSLSATFIPFSPDSLQTPYNYHLLQQPVLHVFWTQCGDMDSYKTTLQGDIKKWFQMLNERNIVDWLIVSVEAYDIRKHTKLLPRTTVLDKIKNDFAIKQSDRCLSVVNPVRSEFRTGTSWRALVANIRLLILTAYDTALIKLEEYIRVQREARNASGWNFCDYFLLQEELAFTLEMLGMYEDALVQYDELDALFTQFVQNVALAGSPPWLSIFQRPIQNWHGISLTTKVNQTYRDDIKGYRISLLDFRCYLFSRQAAMFLFLSRPWEISRRTMPFVSNCTREVATLDVEYPEGALACWIFTCCLEVTRTCEKFSKPTEIDACSQHTAILLELAASNLLKLGKLCGLMPNCKQSTEQIHLVIGLSGGMGDSYSCGDKKQTPVQKLRESLSNQESFSKCYLDLLEQAMSTYKFRKRIRCSLFVAKVLADFYMNLGDFQKASVFLDGALEKYSEDGWPILLDSTRLLLLSCYEKTGEHEKYFRTCLALSNSSGSLELKSKYFEEVTRQLQELPFQDILAPLQENFTVGKVKVNVREDNLEVTAEIELDNKFPADIICSVSLTISEENVGNEDKSADQLYEEGGYDSKLNLRQILNYQEDNTLATVSLMKYCDICKGCICNLKNHCTRKDSQIAQKPVIPSKMNSENSFICESVTLKPGCNAVILKSSKEEMAGKYVLGQLAVSLGNKLHFLTGQKFFSKISYEVKCVYPTFCLEDTSNVAGICTPLVLKICMGTYRLKQDRILTLRPSEQLMIGFSEQGLGECMEVALEEEYEPVENVVSIQFQAKAHCVGNLEESGMERKIWIRCPWSDGEICLVAQFQTPFGLASRVQSCKRQKFVSIILNSVLRDFLTVKNARLTGSDDVHLHSLLPNDSFTIANDQKVKLLWEMKFTKEEEMEKHYDMEFSVNYQLKGKEGHFHCKINASNFFTLYTVDCVVEPTRGGEFCRANAMCHLSVKIWSVYNVASQALMYEVVADQSVWAICNNSTGVLNPSEAENGHFSVKVDVMPLVSGFLPVPLVKLSKYFAAEGKTQKNKGYSPPRCEPFHPGQIFNSSKCAQVHVLISPGVDIT